MYKTREVMQMAFIVPDLDSAMVRWLKMQQTGPFFVIRDANPDGFRYRGKPAEILMDIALCQAGPVQIELIQPKSAGPNVYSDMASLGTEFFHHQCYLTDDIEAERANYAAMGIEVGQEADTGGIHFMYFDTRKLIGCMTEVVQRNEVMEGMCKMIADAAVGWDGTDPIRTMG